MNNIHNANLSKKPAVSVIVPTYNRANLLPRAIKSVLNQTFTNFELIIVDDGSTDNTLEIVRHFNNRRIRCISHDHTKGGSAARNTGINASRSEYVAFLDSDDEWLPAKLNKQLNLYETSSEKVGLVYTWLVHVFDDGRISHSTSRYKGRIYKELLLKNVVGSASSAIIRRKVLSYVKGFDESLPARQDMDLWLRISEHFDVDVVPEVLVRIYHRHGCRRISSSKNNLLSARDLFYQKHKDRLLKGGVAHLHLCDIGQFYREYFDDTSKLRRYFFEAIRVRPKSCLPYFLLLSTLLPKSVYNTLRSVKRKTELGATNRLRKDGVMPWHRHVS